MVAETPNDAHRLIIPDVLPVLPLRDTVVLPFAVVSLSVRQEPSVRLIDDVMRANRLLALVTRRSGEAYPKGPDDLYPVGTAGIIHQLMRTQDGSLRLMV